MKENQIESCKKCLMEKFHADLIKNARRGVLKIDVCAAAKQKIILSWPD